MPKLLSRGEYTFKNAAGPIKNNAFIVMLGLVLANVFWGASSIAAKEALKQLNAVEIVTLRFAIALFILITAALLLKGKDVLKIDAKDIPMFVLLSLANVSVGFILKFRALNYTPLTNFSLKLTYRRSSSCSWASCSWTNA